MPSLHYGGPGQDGPGKGDSDYTESHSFVNQFDRPSEAGKKDTTHSRLGIMKIVEKNQ
jgi:hypothetical protein